MGERSGIGRKTAELRVMWAAGRLRRLADDIVQYAEEMRECAAVEADEQVDDMTSAVGYVERELLAVMQQTRAWRDAVRTECACAEA